MTLPHGRTPEPPSSGLRRMAHWLALVLVLALGACATPAPTASCGIRPYAEVPLRVTHNTPLVDGRINGAPVTLLLDTGAERVLLTQDAVRRLGLSFDQRQVFTEIGAGGSFTSFAAQVRDFELAGLDIPDHPVSALPYPLPSNVTERIDGLLGVTVLGAFDIDLNLPARQMTLYGGLACADTPIPNWSEPFAAIPAEVVRGRFYLPVQLGRTTVTALVDTGATASFVSARAALASGLTPEELAAAPSSIMRGVGPQAVPVRRVRFGDMQVGPERFRGVPMLVGADGPAKVDMILGMDYLGSRRLWFSHARRQMYIMAQPRR